MTSEKENFKSLNSEYSDPDSLSYKKIQIANGNIPIGGNCLDIGMGIGELISLRVNKRDKLFGNDFDAKSVSFCGKKLMKTGINKFPTIFREQFDCITCLDILEHIEQKDVSSQLLNNYNSLNKNGIFISWS
jgi:2-polyprenyl-3-methyl-5-hydroxy-6-metoxy-1,4-benzoquinol methylase